MTLQEQPKARQYGNWRRPRTAGLWAGIGAGGTWVVIVGLIVVMISSASSLLLAVLLALALVGVLVLISWRDRHNMNVIEKIGERMLFLNQRGKRANVYRSGIISKIPGGRRQLPGLLAASELLEFSDSFGDPFAVLHYPSTDTYAITFTSQPEGGSTVDQEQLDQWVADWGVWIAGRGSESGVLGVSATLETAPDTGTRLRQQVESRVDDGASTFSRTVVGQLVDDNPYAAPRISGYVTVIWSGTVRGTNGRKRTVDEMGTYLATRVRQLAASLSATGAGTARVCTRAELCEMVMTAYEPAAAKFFDEGRQTGRPYELSWNDVGPSAADASWDTYRHNGAFSRTWMMTEPPRSAIRETSMRALLSPHGAIQRKRVTLMYRPLDPATGAREVDRQTKEADASAGIQRRQNARMSRAQAAAHRAAEEEADGAAMVPFGMLVTATTTSEEQMADLDFAIETLSAASRIQLRPAYGVQDAAFAAALPVGVIPSRHSRLVSSLGRL